MSLLKGPSPAPRQFNYETLAWLSASWDSAQYMINHMGLASNLEQCDRLIDFSLGHCSVEGLILEFGVFTGRSLVQIAKSVAPRTAHGFDSFEGLPEDWTYFQKQGRFSLEGQIPDFGEPNIECHKGWFDQTLAPFLAENSGPIRFLHIDSDLYSSAKTVLDALKDRIVPGTVILFDEYLNYPGWQQHEYKAWQEHVASQNLKYEYIGFASMDYSVAVVVR
ncbi:MAG: class I SAM-dependent methyltransferase [Armatimonadetes bacterium]|nr:class I SAM-dependent methyltransferase [Armatimonadota bacterium]